MSWQETHMEHPKNWEKEVKLQRMNWSWRDGFCIPTPKRYGLTCWTCGHKGHMSRDCQTKQCGYSKGGPGGLKETQVARKCPKAAQQRVKSRVVLVKRMNKTGWTGGRVGHFSTDYALKRCWWCGKPDQDRKRYPSKKKKIRIPSQVEPTSKTYWTSDRFGYFSAGSALWKYWCSGDSGHVKRHCPVRVKDPHNIVLSPAPIVRGA